MGELIQREGEGLPDVQVFSETALGGEAISGRVPCDRGGSRVWVLQAAHETLQAGAGLRYAGNGGRANGDRGGGVTGEDQQGSLSV